MTVRSVSSLRSETFSGSGSVDAGFYVMTPREPGMLCHLALL
jgi:hypothetical protein